MAKVAVTKDKLDNLALSVSAKSGEPMPLTIDEMVAAVDGIETGGGTPSLQAKTYTVDSAGTETITADSGYDGLSEVEVSVPSASIEESGVNWTFSTVNNQRKYTLEPWAGFSGGFISGLTEFYSETLNAVPSNTTITPTESSQTIGGYNYMMEGAVTVNAIPSNYVGSGITQRSSTDLSASGNTVSVPSGYYASSASKAVASGTEGTPTATKSSVSNHAISVTPSVTNSAGYISGGTKTGTAVSVSASELVSGTLSISASGSHDVTNYASASVAAGGATASATKGSVSNHSVSVTPSVTRTAGYVTAGSANGTAVTVSASELVSGNLAITENGTDIDVTNYATVSVDVEGGGGGGGGGIATDLNDSHTDTVAIFSMQSEPSSFAMFCMDSSISPSATARVASIVYDGTTKHEQVITNVTNGQVNYSSSDAYYNFTGSTLEIITNQANLAGAYGLVYSYGSGVSVDTKDVQVGSGATSITFTGLEDEPLYWVCAFKSSFGTSSGYQRVIYVVYDGTSILGMEMDSTAKASASHWTANYSNGTLTITSQGTNAGGYFHQPGNYQLTYAYGGEPSPYQAKTVTPTTSQQTVEPDAGYEALSQVTVNAIPSTYVQPTSTVGATTYRPSTTAQTIQAGTYHSGAGTIAAVTQTNLSAENVKSGTTITIGNGQSNLWSVTGTYSGGGSSKNVQVAQSTTRVASTSYTKTASLTCSTSGKYDVYWDCFRSSTSGTNGSQLYIGGSAYGTANTTFSNSIHVQSNHLTNVQINANQEVAVYVRSRATNYYAYCGQLTIVQTA